MNILLILPIAIPLTAATICLLLRNSSTVQKVTGVLGMAALLGAACFLTWQTYTDGIQVVQLGDWGAPFGITLVMDLLSAGMVLITSMMGLLVAIYSLTDIDKIKEQYYYYPLLHILIIGINGSFLTGDLFNLYVWFEVMLISSFM